MLNTHPEMEVLCCSLLQMIEARVFKYLTQLNVDNFATFQTHKVINCMTPLLTITGF